MAYSFWLALISFRILSADTVLATEKCKGSFELLRSSSLEKVDLKKTDNYRLSREALVNAKLVLRDEAVSTDSELKFSQKYLAFHQKYKSKTHVIAELIFDVDGVVIAYVISDKGNQKFSCSKTIEGLAK